jgi:hypothetical protein
MSDQSDSASSNKIEKAGQDILQSLQKAADVAEARGRRREGSHISFKMPKIRLQSSKIGLES